MSLADEVPWMCLFVCVLALVQLQFRFCVPCMVGALKVAETAFVVALFRMWVLRDQITLPTTVDFAAYAQTLAAALRNHTEL